MERRTWPQKQSEFIAAPRYGASAARYHQLRPKPSTTTAAVVELNGRDAEAAAANRALAD